MRGASMRPIVRCWPLLCLVVLAACMLHRAAPVPPGVRVTEYRNGRWFDGTAFAPRTMYVVGDVFATRRPARIDTIVDLADGYVVPPFADAHQHLTGPNTVQAYIANFLRDGIFYVKEQAGAPVARIGIDPIVNRPSSIEFISANQGWTSPGGHPVEVIKRGAQFSPQL